MNETVLAQALSAHFVRSHKARSYKIASVYLQPPIVAELQQFMRWYDNDWPVDLGYLFAGSFQAIIKEGQKKFTEIVDRARELEDPNEVVEEAQAVEREIRAANYFMELLSDG